MSDLNENTAIVSETVPVAENTETQKAPRAPRKPRVLTNTKQSNAAKAANARVAKPRVFTMDDKKQLAADKAAKKALMDKLRAEISAIDDDTREANKQLGTRRSGDGVYSSGKRALFNSKCELRGDKLLNAVEKAMKVKVKMTSLSTLRNDTRQTLEIIIECATTTAALMKQCQENLKIKNTTRKERATRRNLGPGQ